MQKVNGSALLVPGLTRSTDCHVSISFQCCTFVSLCFCAHHWCLLSLIPPLTYSSCHLVRVQTLLYVIIIVCTRFTVQYDIWKCDVSYVILDLLYRKIDTSSITTNVGFTHVHPICIPISHFSNALCISTVCGRVLVLSSNIITLSKLLSLQVCIWV